MPRPRSIISQIAAESAKSRSTVYRDCRRIRDLTQCGIEPASLFRTSLRSGAEQDALVRLPAGDRHRLVAIALRGRRVSAKARLRALPPSKGEVRREVATLVRLLNRVRPESRREFIERLIAHLEGPSTSQAIGERPAQ